MIQITDLYTVCKLCSVLSRKVKAINKIRLRSFLVLFFVYKQHSKNARGPSVPMRFRFPLMAAP